MRPTSTTSATGYPDASDVTDVSDVSEMESFEGAVEPDDEGARGLRQRAFRVMHLESVLYDLTDPSPFVHLLEAEAPFRYLVIPVALADAIAIQHAHRRSTDDGPRRTS